MKIYFTEQFKKDLTIPYKQLELTTFKLRSGGNDLQRRDQIYLTDTTIHGIEKSSSLFTHLVPSDENNIDHYILNGIQENKSVQLFFQVDPENNGMYVNNNSLYQIILVYYKDITSINPEEEKLAFLLFNDYTIIQESGLIRIEFSKLQLNTRNFNINIPKLRDDFYCTLILHQNDITEYMETSTEIYNEKELYLKEIYEQTIVPELFNATNTDDLDIIPDVYINNLGLKIY